MSKKHKNICTFLNYIEHFLILVSPNTGYISIYVFTSLVGIPKAIKSSGIELKICAITAGIKKYKSIIAKKKDMHDKIGLLSKSNLNNIEVLVSIALIDSVSSHDEFVSINVLQKYNKMIDKIKNLQKIHHLDLGGVAKVFDRTQKFRKVLVYL